jgi:glycosyltransferase involved in cell wall biosynthesis
MKSISGYNVLVLGVSCFDGMASSTRVRNLIEPLVEKGLIRVFNLIYTMEYKGEKTAKSGTANGIDFRVIELGPFNIFSVVPFLFKGMVSIKKNKSTCYKNIVYNYDYPDAKNIFFLLFAKLIGYKIVFDVVEDYSFFKHYSSFWNRFRMATSRLLIKVSPYIADSYIVISSNLYKKMCSLAKRKVPVHLIPVSVNFKYFNNGSNRNHRSEVKIFYGGSFGHKDGLPYLINAFDELCIRYNNLRLILSGKGLSTDMENIFAEIAQLKCKDKIIYKGYLDTDDYYTLLNHCDIFCMTRINSKFANAGFPFKLGEFLATGKGVIATNIGDVPNYLTNKQNALLIDSESVSQLVEAISYFLNNPNKMRDIGTESRKTARQYFDSEKLSMQLFDIFKSS